MKHYLSFMLLTVLSLLSFTGCDTPPPSGSVQGRITCKGEPVTYGKIVLYNQDAGRGGGANIQPDGTYKTKDIQLGKYRVIIVPPEGETPSGPVTDEIKKFPVPEKYRDFETSDLSVTVEAGNMTFDIDL